MSVQDHSAWTAWRPLPRLRRTVLRAGEASRGLLPLVAMAGLWGCSIAAEPPQTSKAAAKVTTSAAAAKSKASLDEWPAETELRSWKYVVLHHSATDSGGVAEIDAAHKQRFDAAGHPWRGIGYHFVIGNGNGMSDGAIEPTFRWREQCDGAHAGVGQFNELGVGICLIGNFDEAPPTAAQLASVRRLVSVLQAGFRIDNDRVLAHRDLKATACPGAHFPWDEVVGKPSKIVQTSGVAP